MNCMSPLKIFHCSLLAAAARRCFSRALSKSHISRRKAGSTLLTLSSADSFTGFLHAREEYRSV